MFFDVITTFPDIIESVCAESIIGRAKDKGIININAVNLRDFTHDRHKTTDDEPYGGGPGMVMKCEPVFSAVESIISRNNAKKPKVILMTPQGRTFNQKIAEELSNENHIVLICGRYEGVDERIREHLVDDEISIGDYVITGGELAALVIIDAVARLVPGVLGDDDSSVSESFSSGLLEYPHYTRPAVYKDYKVPEVLLSGNHAKIAKWRRQQALIRTYKKRQDLLKSANLSEEDKHFLKELEDVSNLEEE
ncbi:MAG: tRNA (guanosine(37)-N1)-methyltransferase TrmD [Armatimonadota bacterium]